MILALDCESNGGDWWHGSRPFYLTTCTDDGTQYNYLWRTDPYTRLVTVPPEDMIEIQKLIDDAEIIVGQNIKFDAHALYFAGLKKPFPWHKTRDTLIGGHILASNLPHTLDAMVLQYLGEDIRPLENALAEAVQECRRMCNLKAFKEEHGLIAIAKEGRPDMPSAGSDSWRLDYWLPYEMAHLLKLPKDHPWWTVLQDYSNHDSIYTMALWNGVSDSPWNGMEYEIKNGRMHYVSQPGDWNRFRENMEVTRITFEMEQYGLTRSKSRSAAMQEEFEREEENYSEKCISIAREMDYHLHMAKGAGVNGSMRQFIFEVMKLPVTYWTDGGKKGEPQPALNKDAMLEWSLTLDDPVQLEFVNSLANKRAFSSAVTALRGYDEYSIPDKPGSDVVRIHPNQNPVGTSTTRLSSSNPNGQNLSKGKEMEDGTEIASVRKSFGPAEGREWYSLDYENIELKLPAYYSGEESMIELFERPNDPPYFGSYHLLNAGLIYADLFWPLANTKGAFKDKYKNSWYKHLKNFDFAQQYDCGEETGDRAAKRKGSFAKVVAGLPKLTECKQRTLGYGRKYGIVRTMPDKSVPGDAGYPLMVGRYENGQVKATTPWNYLIQGTAGWAKKKAMIRVDKYLKECFKKDKFSGRMVLDVHDELVFDFPAKRPGNREKVLEIKRLMEKSGEDVGIPLTVAVAFHPDNWYDEESF